MEPASGVVLLFGLSAGALLLGFALCFPFFSFLPLYWGVGLAGVFLLSFVACVTLKRRVVPGVYAVTGFVYSILFAWAVFTFTGVESIEGYECSWRIQSSQVEIDLSPIGGFVWSPVSSDALLEYLRKDQPATVHVDVPVTRDFRSVRARGEIKGVNGIPVREH
jgi:hypothetical protein